MSEKQETKVRDSYTASEHIKRLDRQETCVTENKSETDSNIQNKTNQNPSENIGINITGSH